MWIVFQQFAKGSVSNITTIISQFKNYCIKITWLLFICEIKTRSLFWQAIYW